MRNGTRLRRSLPMLVAVLAALATPAAAQLEVANSSGVAGGTYMYVDFSPSGGGLVLDSTYLSYQVKNTGAPIGPLWALLVSSDEGGGPTSIKVNNKVTPLYESDNPADGDFGTVT